MKYLCLTQNYVRSKVTFDEKEKYCFENLTNVNAADLELQFWFPIKFGLIPNGRIMKRHDPLVFIIFVIAYHSMKWSFFFQFLFLFWHYEQIILVGL